MAFTCISQSNTSLVYLKLDINISVTCLQTSLLYEITCLQVKYRLKYIKNRSCIESSSKAINHSNTILFVCWNILNTHLKFAFYFVDFMKCYKVQASCILFTNYFIMRSYMFTSSSSVIIYKEPFMHREVIESNQPFDHNCVCVDILRKILNTC